MKIIFLTLALLFCSMAGFSQETIWTKQRKISEVINFERKLDPEAKFLSQNVWLSKKYYPLADRYKTVNPVIVQRKTVGALPVYAEYFYTPNDSLLRVVSYDWEKGRYGNLNDILESRKQQGGKLEIYLSEYERIRRQLVKTFGKPDQADEKPKTVSDEGQKYLNQNTLWETDELHADLNLIFSSGTQRIRLTLYWKE